MSDKNKCYAIHRGGSIVNTQTSINGRKGKVFMQINHAKAALNRMPTIIRKECVIMEYVPGKQVFPPLNQDYS